MTLGLLRAAYVGRMIGLDETCANAREPEAVSANGKPEWRQSKRDCEAQALIG